MFSIRAFRRISAVVGTVAALLVSGGVAQAQTGAASSELELSAAVRSNRVMSWNTNSQEWGTPKLVAEQIKRFRPQVIGLQETCQWELAETVEILRSAGLRYNYVFGSYPLIPNLGCDGPFPGVKKLGLAILSIAPITNFVEHEYKKDEGPLEQRGYLAVTTRVDGKLVRVFNTHLSDGGASDLRKSQIEDLSVEIKRHGRALVLGDFNAQPWYPEMKLMWENGRRDVDPYCRSQYNRWCQGTHVKTGKKFDYIFHHGVEFEACRLRTASDDHRVVIGDLGRRNGPPAPCQVV